MNDKQPIYILSENTERMLGKDAQRNNILAAKLGANPNPKPLNKSEPF